MVPPAKRTLRKMLLDNASYKVVALFVTVILWVTILGRRDFAFAREMTLEILLPPGYVLVDPPPPDHIQVKVVGPRTSLRRFMHSSGVVVLDLQQVSEGARQVPIPLEALDLPQGLKLVAMVPNRVPVQIARGEKHVKEQK